MKIKILLTLSIFLISIGYSYALDQQMSYYLYQCRIGEYSGQICDEVGFKYEKSLCGEYQFKTELGTDGKQTLSKEKIEIVQKNKLEEYSETGSLDEAKAIYRGNMDKIYECAKLENSIKAYQLNLILIKDTPYLENKLKNKLDTKITELENYRTNNCKKQKGKDTTIKNLVLRKTTYETCKYNSYLEYLRSENKKLESSIKELKQTTNGGPVKTRIDIKRIAEKEKEKMNEIDNEITQIYKVFPVVFKAYIEYENYISIHVLLDIIKADFIS